MHVSCPGCNTEYDVPEAALAKGLKNFRCVVCGRQWPAEIPPAPPPQDLPDAEVPAADDLTEEVPATEPAAEPPLIAAAAPADGQEHKEILERLVTAARSNAQHEKTAAESQSSKRAWLFSLLFLLIAVGYLLLGRETIMQAWPPIIRLYQAMGLA
jgi:predicted Zn finger-like uncharacterized protein